MWVSDVARFALECSAAAFMAIVAVRFTYPAWVFAALSSAIFVSAAVFNRLG